MMVKLRNIISLDKLVVFLLFFSYAITYAQEKGSVEGKIYTKDNKAAAFVNVIIKNTNKGTISDENGYYKINSISRGSKTVTFSLIGLETKSVEVVVKEGELTQLEDVVLNVSNEQLEEVIIEAKRQNKFNQKRTPYVSRLPLKDLENPQVYTVISGELLDELQITDIQGALQNAPGISNVMQGIGSGGVGVNMFLRGFSVDIAMRNGIGTSFRTSTDQANLERIEVIKGPSGTLFGTSIVSSYGGVVNLVTKKPYESFGGSVGYATGSNNLSRLTADINTPLNKEETVLLRLNASKHAESSFQDYGITRNWFFAPSLTYKATDKLTLNIEAEIYSNNSPSTYFNVGSAGITSLDDLNYSFENSYGSDYLGNDINSQNVFVEANYQISDNWKSQTVLSSSSTNNSTNYLFLNFSDESDAQREILNIESQFYTTQIQQNFIGEFKLGSFDNKLVAGLDYYKLQTPYRRTFIDYDVIGADNPVVDFNPEKYSDLLGETDAYRIGTRDQGSYSAYFSDVINFTDKLSVMASLRYDYYDDKENDYTQDYFSPKFGAVYQVVKDKVSLFANYMNGFKNVAPNTLSTGEEEVFKPENATQIEGGVKAELFDGKLNTTLSYYDITVRDATRWAYDADAASWTQLQDGTKTSRGFELELIASPIEGLNIVAGYAYNNSEFVEGDESINGNTPYAAPETTVNLWTSYKLSTGVKGLGFGFGLNSASDTYVDNENTITAPGYTIFNGSIFLDKPVFRLGLKVNNLTDVEYWSNMGGYVQPQKTKNTVVSFIYKF